MKILYVAPRYHTNQVAIMKGWINRGDKVLFISQFQGKSEDYSTIKPIVLGYSKIFKIILQCYKMINKKKFLKTNIPELFQAKLGFPTFNKMRKIINDFSPDLVILRDYSIYNACIYSICKKRGIPGILYNQSPLFLNAEKKDSFIKKLIKVYFPKIRITPVLGKVDNIEVKDKNAFYVPFVVEPCWKRNSLNINGKQEIKILCVGKYEERKKHLELLQTINEMKNKSIVITLIGECSRETHIEYVNKIQEYAQKIDNKIRILTNLSLEETFKEYKKADLFILASEKEFASVAQLEAMSCSLPVIVSDNNGTGNCVNDGVNGFLFKENDFNNLKEKIQYFTNNPEELVEMGKRSYEIIEENYSFEKYYEIIEEINTLLQKKKVTIIIDCPKNNNDKSWLIENLIQKGYKIQVVAPSVRISYIEQRGEAGKIIAILLTLLLCLKASFVSRKGENILCWSQWSGILFQLIPWNRKKKIISYNWLTPLSGKKTRWIYESALKNPKFTAIINSEDTRNKIEEAYCKVAEGKLVYIPDVYDNKVEFMKDFEYDRNRYCFTGGRANRDFETAINIARLCPEITFHLVAARSEWTIKEDIPNNVILHFDIVEEEYYSLMKKAYITFFPLKEDKVSGLINIIRSIQYGKIVLTTSIPATKLYFSKERQKYLLSFKSPKLYAQRIKEIMQYSIEYYEEEVKQMQEYIKKHFSPETAVDIIDEIFANSNKTK